LEIFGDRVSNVICSLLLFQRPNNHQDGSRKIHSQGCTSWSNRLFLDAIPSHPGLLKYRFKLHTYFIRPLPPSLRTIISDSKKKYPSGLSHEPTFFLLSTEVITRQQQNLVESVPTPAIPTHNRSAIRQPEKITCGRRRARCVFILNLPGKSADSSLK
jgi:hypothetical protein